MTPATRAAVQTPLADLGDAVRRHDPVAMAEQASVLHRALLDLLPSNGHAVRTSWTAGTKADLTHFAGELAQLRQSLARQAASVNRAVQMMFPPEAESTVGYGPTGHLQTRTSDAGIRV